MFFFLVCFALFVPGKVFFFDDVNYFKMATEPVAVPDRTLLFVRKKLIAILDYKLFEL